VIVYRKSTARIARVNGLFEASNSLAFSPIYTLRLNFKAAYSVYS
jgi:hypothetical protein